MAKKIKDKERDKIDFGKSNIDTLFNSIFYPTLLSMVFASLFTHPQYYIILRIIKIK